MLKLEVLGDGSFNITLSDRNIYVYGICLGYLVMQTDLFGADKDGKYYSGIELNYQENEDIRVFSDCLILDEYLYNERIKQNTDSNNQVNIENIAKYFGVTKSMVVNHGKRLELIR